MATQFKEIIVDTDLHSQHVLPEFRQSLFSFTLWGNEARAQVGPGVKRSILWLIFLRLGRQDAGFLRYRTCNGRTQTRRCIRSRIDPELFALKRIRGQRYATASFVRIQPAPLYRGSRGPKAAQRAQHAVLVAPLFLRMAQRSHHSRLRARAQIEPCQCAQTVTRTDLEQQPWRCL